MTDDLARERDAEWWAPAYWCQECGHPSYIGTPEDSCERCGATGPHFSDYYRGRIA